MPGSFVLTLHGGGSVTLQTCDETIIALGVALCSFLSGSYIVSRRLAAISMVIDCFAEEAAIYYQATEDGTITAVEAEALAAAVDRFFKGLEDLEDEL
jgi:hypothetical protein